MISMTCECGRELTVRSEFAGRKIKCPACERISRIPTPQPEPAAETELDLDSFSGTEVAAIVPAPAPPPPAIATASRPAGPRRQAMADVMEAIEQLGWEATARLLAAALAERRAERSRPESAPRPGPDVR